MSCCAVVRGAQRSLFFVPRPGLLAGPDIAALEAEAANNPTTKGELLRALHVRVHTHCRVLRVSCCLRAPLVSVDSAL